MGVTIVLFCMLTVVGGDGLQMIRDCVGKGERDRRGPVHLPYVIAAYLGPGKPAIRGPVVSAFCAVARVRSKERADGDLARVVCSTVDGCAHEVLHVRCFLSNRNGRCWGLTSAWGSLWGGLFCYEGNVEDTISDASHGRGSGTASVASRPRFPL